MKKFAFLFAALAVLLFATAGCKGDDGDNGESAEALILNETGNIWYKYTPGTSVDTTVTAEDSTSLANVYIKYETSSGKMIVAACGDSNYATTSKELSSGKWAASAVTLRILGKIAKESSDPTSGKQIIDVSNWGDMSAEKLIKALFE